MFITNKHLITEVIKGITILTSVIITDSLNYCIQLHLSLIFLNGYTLPAKGIISIIWSIEINRTNPSQYILIYFVFITNKHLIVGYKRNNYNKRYMLNRNQ